MLSIVEVIRSMKVGQDILNSSLLSGHRRYFQEPCELPYMMGVTEVETAFEPYNIPLYNMYSSGGILVCIPIGILYVFGIFALQQYMRPHGRLELRLPLILWNVFLSAYSVLSLLRMWPEFADTWRTHGGLSGTVCNSRWQYGATSLWGWLYLASKVVEMGDTVFIVLRKQKLIFLHWYHHLVTMLFTWNNGLDAAATSRWFLIMNLSVHSLMYLYYAVRAARALRIPRWVNKVITGLQLAQMFAGFGLVNYAWFLKSRRGVPCEISDVTLVAGSLMYLSYMILFANFFYHAYLKKVVSAVGGGGAAGDANHNYDVTREGKKTK